MTYWRAELAALTESQGKLTRMEMKAEKMVTHTELSNELLADGGQSFQDQLERKMGGAVSWNLDNAFLTGTGAGQPLGVLNSSALVTVSKSGPGRGDVCARERAQDVTPASTLAATRTPCGSSTTT